MITRPDSITDQVYKALKRRIVNGEIDEGERLVEDTLAEELGVSKTPVREALARLASERLVERFPGRGAVVRTISYEEVADFLEIREVLEELATQKAAARVTQEDIMKLQSILGESEKAGAEGNPNHYSALDLAFHRTIIDMGDSTALQEIIPLLHDKIHAVMKASVTLPGRFAESIQEHTMILEALIVGDPQVAGVKMREHIKSTRAAVMHRLQLQKDSQE